jgi:hypothetical protein
MVDKTKRRSRPKVATRREPAPRRGPGPHPNPPLAFDPFTPGQEHPEWVMKGFPSYVEHEHENLARSTRVLEHRGNTITITTTYEVRVDERLVTLHMMVDEEGRLWSHLCPYLTFTTAPELVSHLLQRMPHLFEPEAGEPERHAAHHHHGGHR